MVAPHLLGKLKPHRKLQKGLTIAGILNGNLRVLDSKYRVITSWSDVEVMTFNEVYALEGNESNSLPGYMYKYLCNPYQLYALRSWELIHGVARETCTWSLEYPTAHFSKMSELLQCAPIHQ